MPTSTLFEIIFLLSLYYHHLSPLSVMFSSSCRVAKLTHHPLLIGNQDDSGDGMFLPAVYRLVDLLENPGYRSILTRILNFYPQPVAVNGRQSWPKLSPDSGGVFFQWR
jgi:hypothetical protein